MEHLPESFAGESGGRSRDWKKRERGERKEQLFHRTRLARFTISCSHLCPGGPVS